MPDLPEVETARRGIAPHLIGQRIAGVIVRQRQLRWAVPAALVKAPPRQTHRALPRTLRALPCHTPPQKADHVDITLANGQCLRLRDPRRFGSLLWTTAGEGQKPLGDSVR